MKMQRSLLKHYWEFQDVSINALNQVQSPSEGKSLCDYTGTTRCPWLWAWLSQEHAGCRRQTNLAEGVSQSWSVGEAHWMVKTPVKGVSRLEFIYRKCLQMLAGVSVCQRWFAGSCFCGTTWWRVSATGAFQRLLASVTGEGEEAQTGIRNGSSFPLLCPSNALYWKA